MFALRGSLCDLGCADGVVLLSEDPCNVLIFLDPLDDSVCVGGGG